MGRSGALPSEQSKPSMTSTLAAGKGGDKLTIQGIEGKQGVEAEEQADVKALALTLRSGQKRI